MNDNAFVDTNIFVYAHVTGDNEADKSKRAIALLESFDGRQMFVSAQVIGELFDVLTRKCMFEHAAARRVVSGYMDSAVVLPVTSEDVSLALDIQARYQYRYWDCLILATARAAGCGVIYSEDLQNKQVVYGRMQIIDPLK